MKNKNFSISKRVKSFKHAFNGLFILIQEEHNSRIHLLAMLIAIILGFIFEIQSFEWFGVILSIGLVIAMEAINSAIENLADFCTEEKHELIKKTKDLAAAGVLWSSIAALIIGLIIFVPRFVEIFI